MTCLFNLFFKALCLRALTRSELTFIHPWGQWLINLTCNFPFNSSRKLQLQQSQSSSLSRLSNCLTQSCLSLTNLSDSLLNHHNPCSQHSITISSMEFTQFNNSQSLNIWSQYFPWSVHSISDSQFLNLWSHSLSSVNSIQSQRFSIPQHSLSLSWWKEHSSTINVSQ